MGEVPDFHSWDIVREVAEIRRRAGKEPTVHALDVGSMPLRELLEGPICCAITGNPWGSDTRAVGNPCQCNACRACARIKELETENDSLRKFHSLDQTMLQNMKRALAGKDRATLPGGDEDTSDEQKPGNARGSG